jgi:RNA polymerase sigma-70 factor (ECF subfamily)
MGSRSFTGTSPALLGRLRLDPSDRSARGQFVQRYAPLILGWCRHWNLQPADAEEVTQNVLLKLVEKLRVFDARTGA